RSPIDGIVVSRAGVVGEPVVTGSVVATVTNPLVDDQPVADLRFRLNRIRTNLNAMRQQQTLLTAFLADLTDRVASYRTAKVRQLELETDRTARDRLAKLNQLEQLVRDMNRKRALQGFVPRTEIEQATTAVRVAAQQVASLDEQLAAAKAAAASAEQGVMVEANSSNDVAYSDQRADEVRVRLLELERAIADTQAEATETEGRLTSASGMLTRLKHASVTIPSNGMIWRLGAGPGEHVGAGDLLAQVVDCGAAFLAVDVPQERLANIDLTATAKFRLAGEHQDRTGHIAAITGDAAVRGDGALATVPAVGNRPVASVLVSVPPSPNQLGGCLVGRTARVRLPTTRGSWFDWAARWWPL
ncbi:MAG TPA: HlyD family efflux transporter periplasmic adaptor subunit, partial [Rhodopila sp.]|nr:HlyD family efflux transporter periplasmic adaptor subunit [Rhodopila sp.]